MQSMPHADKQYLAVGDKLAAQDGSANVRQGTDRAYASHV